MILLLLFRAAGRVNGLYEDQCEPRVVCDPLRPSTINVPKGKLIQEKKAAQTSYTRGHSGIADCYSANERAAMDATQRLREHLFRPLLRLLCAVRVTPDQVTLLALIAGLAFCPLYFLSQPAALVALALHVLLDGLDGPLARYERIESSRGSFTDTVSDQIVVVATTITLMFSNTLSAPAGGVYIFLYTVVVAFAMVRNALNVPYSWLFRPRFLVYAWLLIETSWPSSLEYVIWGANVLLAGKMISGFVRIRARL